MNIETYKIIFLLIFFIFATTFSFLINGLFLKFSKNLGMRNITGDSIRWATQAKPALGGISFFIVFLMSIVFYNSFFPHNTNLLDLELLGIVGSISMGFLMGLADDAYNTQPILKFSVQIFCGVVLIITGTYIHFFENNILNYGLTVFWVVAMMNSINMLDNMDGVTTTVSGAITFAFIVIISFLGAIDNVNIVIATGVFASLAGFLLFNFYPSKLYMGDTGSQFLGVFIAAFSIKYIWNLQITGSSLTNVYFIFLIFLIPITDTTAVVLKRVSRKQSPFVGGKDHTTHHLYYNGVSERKVVLLFALISIIALSFLTAHIFYKKFAIDSIMILGLIFSISVFLILNYITLFHETRLKRRKKKD